MTPTVIRLAILEDHTSILRDIINKIGTSDALKIVSVAETLAEGEAFLEQPIDVALMDLSLPDGMAYELIERLTQTRPTRCVVLSSLDDAKSVLKAFSHGACGYILKDAPGFELRDVVTAAMAGDAPVSPSIARFLLANIPQRPKIKLFKRQGFLSKRETEILTLAATGSTRKEIARDLGISHHTVAEYFSNIYRKYDVHSKSAAIAKGLSASDIELPTI